MDKSEGSGGKSANGAADSMNQMICTPGPVSSACSDRDEPTQCGNKSGTASKKFASAAASVLQTVKNSRSSAVLWTKVRPDQHTDRSSESETARSRNHAAGQRLAIVDKNDQQPMSASTASTGNKCARRSSTSLAPVQLGKLEVGTYRSAKEQSSSTRERIRVTGIRPGTGVHSERVLRLDVGGDVRGKPGEPVSHPSQRDGNDGKRDLISSNITESFLLKSYPEPSPSLSTAMRRNDAAPKEFVLSLDAKKENSTYQQMTDGSTDEAPRRGRSTLLDGQSRSAVKKVEYEPTTRDLLTAFTRFCCQSSTGPNWSLWKEYFRPLTEGFNIDDYLQSFSHIFLRSDSKEVRIKLSLNMCWKNYNEVECADPRCTDLHICKFFLFGERPCKSGESCRFGHGLSTARNLTVLQKHFLDHLMAEEIALLLKHCGKDLPSDSDKEIASTCKSRKSVQDCRPANRECRDRHCEQSNASSSPCETINTQSTAVWLTYGDDDNHSAFALPEEPNVLTKKAKKGSKKSIGKLSDALDGLTLEDVVGNKASGAQVPSAGSVVQRQQPSKLCTFHLRGQCRYGEMCIKYHSENRVPFQWQWSENYSQIVDRRWMNLKSEDNWDAERAFCDPSRDSCSVDEGNGDKLHIDFSRFRLSRQGDEYGGRVRRLGTKSVDAETHAARPFTTLWKWYNRRDNGVWIHYGTSDAIEQAYKEKRSLFHFPDQSEIIFSSLLHVDRNEHRQRMIKRRPELFNVQSDFKTKRYLTASLSGYPSSWHLTAGTAKNDFDLVEVLNKGCTEHEYREIARHFAATLPEESIKSLKRIQNYVLWEEFSYFRAKLEEKRKGKSITVRRLFHGTASMYVKAICQQGFDFRLSGLAVGTKYGKGSYFARDAKYSKNYCQPQGCNMLFVLQVIVGEFTKGEKDYTRPPPKDPTRPCHKQELFDTCVDDPENPSIFVVFDQRQSYLEYLIEF